MIIDNIGKTGLKAECFQDEGGWIAECLEYNLCAYSKTLEGLHKKFKLAVDSHVAVRLANNQKPFEGLQRTESS